MRCGRYHCSTRKRSRKATRKWSRKATIEFSARFLAYVTESIAEDQSTHAHTALLLNMFKYSTSTYHSLLSDLLSWFNIWSSIMSLTLFLVNFPVDSLGIWATFKVLSLWLSLQHQVPSKSSSTTPIKPSNGFSIPAWEVNRRWWTGSTSGT